MLRRFLLHLLLLALGLGAVPRLMGAGRAQHFILVVWDGMRPDFISPELTPTLEKLRREGVWFANHHSAYPTSTEVNGAVLATGAFPQRNGITANKEYRPEVDPLRQFGTQWLPAVRRGDELSGGNYLAVPTVAELAQAKGFLTAVVGAKPVALLHDRRPRPEDARGWVWFVDGALPESKLTQLTNRFGPFPAPVSPNLGRDAWATRCLLEAFWERGVPRYSLLWLSEPDWSQHDHGPGAPEALTAIRSCDQRLAAVLAELERRGLRAQTDVLVVSDHGFSTIGAKVDVAATLRAAGLNARCEWTQPPADGDVVVVGNGGSVLLYVKGGQPPVVARAVQTLQRTPFAGVIFTRDGLPGTFPLAAAGLATRTAPDVVVATRWQRSGETNGHPVNLIFNDGYPEYEAGCGMHVTLCPTDLHNMAVAAGPDFRRGLTSTLPSGNVDIAPTLLWLMGLAAPQPLDGRVLTEALAAPGPPVGAARPGRLHAREVLGAGVWEQYLEFTEVNGVRYLKEGNGAWTPDVPPSPGTAGASAAGAK